jgi:hypothetical protein
MNNELSTHKFIVVRNFIGKQKAKKLAKEFLDFSTKNPKTYVDPQAPNAYHRYNYLPFVDLLLDTSTKVEKIIGTKLYPCYTFARIYTNNDELKPHKDRDSCEISITLNIDCDETWAIWFSEDPRGFSDKSYRTYVSLSPGDAVLYFGQDILHGRDKFEGNYCTQVFLHWVQRKGKSVENLFDHVRYKQCVLVEAGLQATAISK